MAGAEEVDPVPQQQRWTASRTQVALAHPNAPSVRLPRIERPRSGGIQLRDDDERLPTEHFDLLTIIRLQHHWTGLRAIAHNLADLSHEGQKLSAH